MPARSAVTEGGPGTAPPQSANVREPSRRAARNPAPLNSHGVLELQKVAGNAGVVKLLRMPEDSNPADLSPDVMARIRSAREFWQRMTLSRPPPATTSIADAVKQAPPDAVGVTATPSAESGGSAAHPSAPPASEGYVEPSLPSGAQPPTPAPSVTSEGSDEPTYDEPTYDQPELSGRTAPSVPDTTSTPTADPYSPPPTIPTTTPDPYTDPYADPYSPAPTIPTTPVQPPSSAASTGTAPRARGWARVRQIRDVVFGGQPDRKMLPQRQGPVKLLHMDDPYQAGSPQAGPPTLKPRRPGGWTTWHNYWLEALDPKHRVGFELAKRWEEWVQAEEVDPQTGQRQPTKLSFWDWLDQQEPGAPEEVTYLSKQKKRNQYMLLPKDGRLYQSGKLFDTTGMETAASGSGYAIFVVSTAGAFYSDSHVIGKFHHSTFLAGGAVRAAGEIKVKQGVLRKITRKTGHYRADREHLLYALNQLVRRGVDIGQAEVWDFAVGPDGELLRDPQTDRPIYKPFDAAEYLQHNGLPPPPEFPTSGGYDEPDV